MMELDNCKGCDRKMDHDVLFIAYYYNGKPLYSQWCKTCMRNHYKKMKAEFGLDKDKK